MRARVRETRDECSSGTIFDDAGRAGEPVQAADGLLRDRWIVVEQITLDHTLDPLSAGDRRVFHILRLLDPGTPMAPPWLHFELPRQQSLPGRNRAPDDRLRGPSPPNP
jgi:hypothetical protein